MPVSEAECCRHADTLWEVAAVPAQQGDPSSTWGPMPPAPKPSCPPACLLHPRPAARTHRVDTKGVGSQEDAGDVGVQGEQRVLGQEGVAVATTGRVLREAGGPGVEGTWGTVGWVGRPHLQPDWLAMAATLQPEGKITVGRLKHSL